MQRNIDSLREKYINLVNEMVESGFCDWVDGCEDRYFIDQFELWLEQVRDNFPTLSFSHGVTRIVVWDDDYRDCVLKFQAPMRYPIVKDDETPYAFDYCRSEKRLYEKAEEWGIEDCFAWCDKLTTVMGQDHYVDIYIMEFCDVDSDSLESDIYTHFSDMVEESVEEYIENNPNASDQDIEDYRAEVEEEYCGSCDCSDTVIDYAVTMYDDCTANDLRNFIDEFEINDLHSANWGYRGALLVLTDYGGYARQIM